jgi:hypothetical protein
MVIEMQNRQRVLGLIVAAGGSWTPASSRWPAGAEGEPLALGNPHIVAEATA